jgi:lysyl-tRNA synthetase, class II
VTVTAASGAAGLAPDALATRQARSARRARPRPRMQKLPYLISRVFFLAAIILFAQALFPNVFWIGTLVDAYSTVFVPIDGGSIALAAVMLVVGAALARRKRIGWLLAVAACAVVLAGDLLSTVVLLALTFTDVINFSALTTLARLGFNLASLGAVTTCLVVYRAEFTARRPPGSIRKALVTLAVGLVITVGVGLLLVTVFPTGIAGGPRGRLAWVVQRIALAMGGGDTNLVRDPLITPPSWISTTVGLLFSLTLIAALIALVRSQHRAALMSAEDEPRVRALVAESPEDSLAYFATRRDKSVVFAENGHAAVLYRVDLGVCLASSDPIGPPDYWEGAIRAWQQLVETYGWTPAVLGASEAGATAYARKGLRVIRLGDEAIIETKEFRLDGRELRPVRQAVQRLERMGYRTRVRRHRDIPLAELRQLIGSARAWRDAETERGFSMALGRLGDPLDGDCLMVEALFPAQLPSAHLGEVAGILSFVPWGSDGFSLDVMRRHPEAENGVTELMVCGVLAAGREIGIRRVSLNFAVFRSAFEEGARIGAGPILRLWRRMLLVASRWWQIEALFRSNVKYRPEWQPRFLCFAETRDIALVGAAAGVAEGFIDLPDFLSPPPTDVRSIAVNRPAPVPVAALPAAAPAGSAPARVPEQTRRRLAVRQSLLDSGIDPYPPTFRPSRSCADLRLGVAASVAGRVLNVRKLGGVIFVKIRDWTGDTQLLFDAAVVGRTDMDRFRHVVDLGDHVGVEGTVVLSRSGELSVQVTEWRLTAKSLRPPPDKHRGITDPETRVRQRYLDLATNQVARGQVAARSRVIRSVRNTLDEYGFLEVETPILQTIHGGANARPFRTHINAYDLELYLRIAPELYLKRLMVGGLDKIFEIGRNFRNEGADASHNPEFTMLEAYQAYGDYTTMRAVAKEMITRAAHAAHGGTVVRGTDEQGSWHEVDLAEPWPVIPIHEAISAACGIKITADTSREDLARLADSLKIAVNERWSRGAVILELYEQLVEHRTIQPTFYTDFPADVSPLTRPHREDPRLAERWDLVAFGAEIGTAYSELVDPVEQRARLTEQSLQAAGGDPEAMELDEDFLTALEYAMPPTGGLGMGMDRLVMMLTNTSIRDTIAFPLVRPRGH